MDRNETEECPAGLGTGVRGGAACGCGDSAWDFGLGVMDDRGRDGSRRGREN